MTKLKVRGFTPADRVKYDDIEFSIEWFTDDDAEGVETFRAKPRVSTGLLFRLEAGDNSATLRLIAQALRSDDHELDEDDRPIDGTSSLERWEALTDDEKRQIPGLAITDVLNGLYKEYTARRNPLGASAHPTNSGEESSEPSSTTGNTSTGSRRRGTGSTSRSSQRTSA